MKHRNARLRVPALCAATVAMLLAQPAAAARERVVSAPYRADHLGQRALTDVVGKGERTLLVEVIDDLGHPAIGSVRIGGSDPAYFCGKVELPVQPGAPVVANTPYGYFNLPPAGCAQGVIGTLRLTFR